jgi:hypothetical protein
MLGTFAAPFARYGAKVLHRVYSCKLPHVADSRTERHNARLMGTWATKYTPEQRRAVLHARLNRRLSGRVISDLARRGELEDLKGQPLEPFEIPKDTVYSLGADEERRRRKAMTSELVSKPPEDAVEELRRRLVDVLDRETLRLMRHSRQHERDALDAAQVQRVARALRELNDLTKQGEKPRNRGVHNGQPREPEAEPDSGTAAKVLAAMRGGNQPAAAQSDPILTQPSVEQSEGDNTSGTGTAEEPAQDASAGRATPAAGQAIGGGEGQGGEGDTGGEGGPGAWVRAQRAKSGGLALGARVEA